MKKALLFALAIGLLLVSPSLLKAQHFDPVYESIYQPMNIIVDEATIDGVDLEAGDEIGIFDTTIAGLEICVGSIVLAGPILPGDPLPIVASTDDPLTPNQDGFLDGNPILYRFWDSSEGVELICVTMVYDPGFDMVFVSLGTALGSLSGIYSATANAGPDDETCEDTPYTLSGTATNQASVLWTTSGDGTFSNAAILNAIYTPGSGDITSGSATLTLTAYAVAPCGEHAVDDMVLSIQALPTADAGADDEICENNSYTLSGSATNQQSALWTTAGDGTFDDPTLLSATYTPGAGDISNGSVVLTLTAYAVAPCGTNASDDMTLSIQAQSTANAGDDDDVCEGNSYMLSGSATNYASVLWTSSGDGTFDDPGLLTATYTPGTGDISNGSVTLSLTAEAIAPCSTGFTDSMNLGIQGLPTANAGSDAEICEGEDYTLSGGATNQESVLWSTAGDGVFDDATLLGATYTPGSGDISNGGVILSLTSYAISPCSTSAIDDMMLTIDSLPEIPTTPQGPTEVDIHFTPTSEYETQSAGADTYLWTLYPVAAGNIAGNTATAVVTWNASFHGYAYVKVFAMNNCGATVSDSLEVFVYNSVGVSDKLSRKLEVLITPNPNRGFFKLTISATDGDLNMVLISADGTIAENSILLRNGSTLLTKEFDFSNLPKGIYFLRLFNDKVSHVEKLILQ